MGNNNSCKTKSIRTIQLKLHDGLMRDLKEVRYIPEMKKKGHISGCIGIIWVYNYLEEWWTKCFFKEFGGDEGY